MVVAAILRNLFEVDLGGGSPGVAACVGNPGLWDAAPFGAGEFVGPIRGGRVARHHEGDAASLQV